MTTLAWLPLRVLPLLVTVAYLAVLHGPLPVTATDWVLGVAAAAVTGAAMWAPLPATVVQSVLLSLTAGPAQSAAPVMFLLAMITLGELWIRRAGWQCWAGTVVFAAAQLRLYVPYFDPVRTPASVVLTTLPPVLLGVYIRSVLRVALDADRRRVAAVRDARVAERTAIARELHDLVAHHMASIAVQVGAARHALGGTNPRVDEALAQAHTTTRAGLSDLKRLVAVLRDPDTTRHDEAGAAIADADGLPTALAAALERTRAAGVVVDADIDPAVSGLDSMRRLAVLRVVQEGLTNVVRHGGPHATLVVHASDDVVRITVTDDGPGGRPGRGGFGLVGMRERVELLGGAVRAGSGPGWELAVTIPVGEP